MSNGPTPVVKKHVSLCDCYEGDKRGECFIPYAIVNGIIRCSSCGTVPPEIGTSPIPEQARVELRITQHLDSQITRTYQQLFPPEAER